MSLESYYVELNFWGNELIPGELTALLGVEPSTIGICGDYIQPKTLCKWKESCWRLIIPIEADNQAEREILKIIDLLQSCPNIKNLCNERNLTIDITIVLYVEKNSVKFRLSSNLLKNLAVLDIDFNINFDIYCMGED